MKPVVDKGNALLGTTGAFRLESNFCISLSWNGSVAGGEISDSTILFNPRLYTTLYFLLSISPVPSQDLARVPRVTRIIINPLLNYPAPRGSRGRGRLDSTPKLYRCVYNY